MRLTDVVRLLSQILDMVVFLLLLSRKVRFPLLVVVLSGTRMLVVEDGFLTPTDRILKIPPILQLLRPRAQFVSSVLVLVTMHQDAISGSILIFLGLVLNQSTNKVPP